MTILQKLPNGVYTLSIPKNIVNGLGWDKGDRIAIGIAGANKITLQKVAARADSSPEEDILEEAKTE